MIDLKDMQHPIIFFDGVCNLCSNSVQFIIQKDTKQYFRFASLQSNLGKEVLRQFNISTVELGSFILWENGCIYTKSTGALRVIKKLKAPWFLLYGFIIIPTFIRNAVYNFIAKNRYRWFGKKEVCWLPTPELRNLFLDQ